MNASFRQKSAGVSLVVIGALAVYYFARVLDFWRADASLRTGEALPDGFVPLVKCGPQATSTSPSSAVAGTAAAVTAPGG